jgi:DNA-binding response OmpR family regulator
MENPSKIIIIDDNPDFRFTMETFLKRNGFETLTAEDGQHGMYMIEKERPDLILLDVMMESLYSGFDVCKSVQSNPDLKDIPIIGISGMATELGVSPEKTGNDDYFRVDEFFEKPVDKDKLLDRINELLAEGLVRKGRAVRIHNKVYIKR